MRLITNIQNLKNSRTHLKKISFLADEMHSLEPTNKLEFVPLAGLEKGEQHNTVLDQSGENLNLEAIYETALTLEESDKQESFSK